MLELDRAGKTFSGPDGEVSAVGGVSFSVKAGELVSVQGPSGCGKSTLLLMCGALLRPTDGTVRLDGQDPYRLSPNRRSIFRAENVGFIFQQFHLIPYLSVLDNVLAADIAAPRPGHRERARELMGHFKLDHRAHHVPSELSVGEKQRVALARALLNEPKLILADEPTGNLDPQNAVTVLDALRDYADGGGTVLLVTHDPAAAERAHRVLHMENGRIAAEAPGA